METVASVPKTTTRVTRKRSIKSKIATQPKVSQGPPSADSQGTALPLYLPSNSHPVTVFLVSVTNSVKSFIYLVCVKSLKEKEDCEIEFDIHHPLQETSAKRRRGRNMQKQQAALANTVSG
jgi:hypothetical protein